LKKGKKRKPFTLEKNSGHEKKWGRKQSSTLKGGKRNMGVWTVVVGSPTGRKR